MAFEAPSLEGRALRWLSQREHSRAELGRKLRRAAPEAEPAAIEALLDELQTAGWLSEARAAASLLHTQGARYGSRRLRQVLQARQLPAEIVADTLQAATATELERARAVWQRRHGEAPTNALERARQMRFLLARGFPAEVATRVLREAGAAADDDPGDDAPA
jgi:regulatory protein